MMRGKQDSRADAGGFTLVEAVVSIVLVGVVLVASLQTVVIKARSDHRSGESRTGEMLTTDLMNEILLQAYQEPGSTSDSIYLGNNERGGPGRTPFDDVDDYTQWSRSPPQNRDGSTIPGLDGWRRSVSIAWVSSSDLRLKSFTSTGIKQITVTVLHNNRQIAQLVAIRSNAWP